MQKPTYKLQLSGAFQLFAPDGNEIYLSEKKARAMIAILATSRKATRTRLMLRATLWHRTSSPQDAYSLRQTLHKTSRLLEGRLPFLCSDRDTVWLTNFKLLPRAADETFAPFFEDAPNLGGPFGEWLDAQRAAAPAAVQGARPRPVAPTPIPFAAAPQGTGFMAQRLHHQRAS